MNTETIVIGAGIETAKTVINATDDCAVRLKVGYAMHRRVCENMRGQGHVKGYDLGNNDLDVGLHQLGKGMMGKPVQIFQAPVHDHYANWPITGIAGGAVFRSDGKMATGRRAKYKLKQWSRT